MKWYYKILIFRNKFITPYVQILLLFSKVASCFMSLVFLLTAVYKYGFQLTAESLQTIDYIYHWVWITFLGANTIQLLFNFRELKRNYRKISWLFNLLLYLTLLPVFFDHHIFAFFSHTGYRITLLAILSVLNLSDGFAVLLGKKTNPSLIFSFSFLILILVGTCLLLLPKSTYAGISFIDALFISTSSVCITGLSTVDIPAVFTPTGQFVILLLIQIGGLGVMTITSFFALFFMGNTSIHSQMAVKDMVSSQSLSSLLSTLLYILTFTLIIEVVGAVWLYMDIHGTLGMTISEELFFVAFHAVSAFCNAGFSTLSGNLGNELLLNNHNGFYLCISILIILGGIGYPILENLLQTIVYEIKRWYAIILKGVHIPRKVHLYNLNTRIAVGMTIFLVITGSIILLCVEWNHAFAQMPVVDKFIQALFNAVCPRTAGFNSVSLTTMGFHTLLIYMLFMVIGGGTQSTAGGVKVNVFAVVILNLRAVMKNDKKVNIFNRELSTYSIRRSNATLILYLLVVCISFFLITLFEPELPVFPLLFECISALSTVGASLDLTPLLSVYSKLLLVVLMFVGRVGLLTLVSGLIGEPKVRNYQYPSDYIIIN